MDQEQLERLRDQRDEALMNDDMETFLAVSKKIPLPPEVAQAACFGFGADFLKKSGFNLSAANERFGPDWLDR